MGSPPDLIGVITLPSVESPRASVLILAWRNVSSLARCLTSLQKHLPAATAEVIIVLNGASHDVVQFVRVNVRGGRVVHSDVNLGFAGGCNSAAAAARGDYLVLLNDDAEIERGWLEALIDAADAHPRAGAIGSRILFPDGTLQEAGCVIWRTGATTAVGRYAASDAEAFATPRFVDYCSGCSLLIRRDLWQSLGGMDERYFPAYYEDVDVCLAMRAAGWRVLYQPASVVRHVESASSDAEFKRFLVRRNRERFVEKWGRALTIFPWPDGADSSAASTVSAPPVQLHPRVLVVDNSLERREAWVTRVAELAGLAAEGGGVTVAAPDGRQTPPMPLRAGIQRLDEPLEAHLSRSDVLYEAVVLRGIGDVARYTAVVRRWQPQAAFVYEAQAGMSAPDVSRQADCVMTASRTAARQFRRSGVRCVHLLGDLRASLHRAADTSTWARSVTRAILERSGKTVFERARQGDVGVSA